MNMVFYFIMKIILLNYQMKFIAYIEMYIYKVMKVYKKYSMIMLVLILKD